MNVININEANNHGKCVRMGSRVYMIATAPNARSYDDSYGLVDLTSGVFRNFFDFIEYAEDCGYEFIGHDIEDCKKCDFYGMEEVPNLFR